MKGNSLSLVSPFARRGRGVAGRPSVFGLRLASLFIVATLALAQAFYGCATNPVTGKSEFSVISEKDEIALGAQAYNGAIAEIGGEYNDPVLSAYVNDVGQSLAKVSHRPNLPYEFTVVGSSVMNAFALPGGKIVITTGLLSKFDDEAEVAGVLGHEIGHVTARHAARMISRSYLFQIPLIVGSMYAQGKGKGEELVALSSVGLALLQLKYSRAQESQADGLGMQYEAKAGYNPKGMVEVLEVLQSAHEKEPSALEGMLMTHPLTSSRISDAKTMLAKDYPSWQSREDMLFADRFKSKTERLMTHVGAFEHYDAAEGHYQKGELDQALQEYRAAIEIDGAQPQFHCGVGEVYIKKDDTPNAMKSFERAKELDPELFRGRLDLGYAQFLAERYEPAAGELEAAVAIVPTSPSAQYFLGRSYEKLGRSAEAIESYENAAALAPDTEIGKDAGQRAAALKAAG
jgi:predicted Zn-dependent protease